MGCFAAGHVLVERLGGDSGAWVNRRMHVHHSVGMDS